MRRSEAMALLAATHARIVELADGGVDAWELAMRLDMDPCAVGPLLRVARSKLAALEAMDEPGGTDLPGGTP
jgi:hypothetical protein